MSYLVIGSGKAQEWSINASDVEPQDADLLAAAREHSLFDKGADRGICNLAGLLRGDGWLCVVGGDVEESDLDGDPAVIAYCSVPFATVAP